MVGLKQRSPSSLSIMELNEFRGRFDILLKDFYSVIFFADFQSKSFNFGLLLKLCLLTHNSVYFISLLGLVYSLFSLLFTSKFKNLMKSIPRVNLYLYMVIYGSIIMIISYIVSGYLLCRIGVTLSSSNIILNNFTLYCIMLLFIIKLLFTSIFDSNIIPHWIIFFSEGDETYQNSIQNTITQINLATSCLSFLFIGYLYNSIDSSTKNSRILSFTPLIIEFLINIITGLFAYFFMKKIQNIASEINTIELSYKSKSANSSFSNIQDVLEKQPIVSTHSNNNYSNKTDNSKQYNYNSTTTANIPLKSLSSSENQLLTDMRYNLSQNENIYIETRNIICCYGLHAVTIIDFKSLYLLIFYMHYLSLSTLSIGVTATSITLAQYIGSTLLLVPLRRLLGVWECGLASIWLQIVLMFCLLMALVDLDYTLNHLLVILALMCAIKVLSALFESTTKQIAYQTVKTTLYYWSYYIPDIQSIPIIVSAILCLIACLIRGGFSDPYFITILFLMTILTSLLAAVLFTVLYMRRNALSRSLSTASLYDPSLQMTSVKIQPGKASSSIADKLNDSDRNCNAKQHQKYKQVMEPHPTVRGAFIKKLVPVNT